jgi:hypothetical protein
VTVVRLVSTVSPDSRNEASSSPVTSVPSADVEDSAEAAGDAVPGCADGPAVILASSSAKYAVIASRDTVAWFVGERRLPEPRAPRV